MLTQQIYQRMTKNIVNIIWADDEVDSILDDICIENLESKGFNVVGRAHDGIELKHLLNGSNNVNAVIIDANFCEEGIPEDDELVSTGFEYARYLQKEKNGSIPFFLFTGRAENILRQKYKILGSNALDDFPRGVRWFSKTVAAEFDMMFNAIRSEVESINSPEFIIDNRYNAELEAVAFLGEKCKETIRTLLIQDYTNTLASNVDPFNGLRKIVEVAFDKLQDYAIIPPINEINGTIRYLHNDEWSNQGYTIHYIALKKGILHKSVASSLWNCIKLIQDGSHRNNRLVYKVDIYWEGSKDTIFLRSIFWSLLSLVKWTFDICTEYPDSVQNSKSLWSAIL